MTARIWALGLAALPLVACKPKAESQAPQRDVHGWTLAEIEAELARNDTVLAGEGIMVAAAPTVTPPSGPDPGLEPPVTAPEGETDPDPDVDDGSGAEPGEDPELVQPEPMPTPTAMPERPVYADEAPAAMERDAPALRSREARKRRMAARSRREASTRCERVCGLAEATCELEAQICELATRHPDEPRYAQACLRAEQQCIAASEACQRCEE